MSFLEQSENYELSLCVNASVVRRWTTSSASERPAQAEEGERRFSCEYPMYFSTHVIILHLIIGRIKNAFFQSDVLWCWTQKWTKGSRCGRTNWLRLDNKRSKGSLCCSNLKENCWRKKILTNFTLVHMYLCLFKDVCVSSWFIFCLLKCNISTKKKKKTLKKQSCQCSSVL